MDNVSNLLSDSMAIGIHTMNKEESSSEGCIIGTHHKSKYPKKEAKRAKRFRLVHSDVCGPMSTNSLSDLKYFVLLLMIFQGRQMLFFVRTRNVGEFESI